MIYKTAAQIGEEAEAIGGALQRVADGRASDSDVDYLDEVAPLELRIVRLGLHVVDSAPGVED